MRIFLVQFATVLIATSTMVAQTRTFYPNTQRYKDSMPPTSNRSGAATLTGRALLAKDGETLIELTTLAAFDTGETPPGRISKVQVKALKANGVVSYGNYLEQETGGYWSLKTRDFTAGQNLQIQANIREIEPTRTDVVTIEVPVVKLPDLAVTSLQNPVEVYTDTVITVFAQVSELNGVVGGTTYCALFVDGWLRMDHGSRIWVDRGDTVSCQFAISFDKVGTHTIAVQVGNFAPADWDTTNNIKTATINVVSPREKPSTFSASAMEIFRRYRELRYGWWGNQTESFDWYRFGAGAIKSQSFSMGALQYGINFTFPVDVTRTESTNSTYIVNAVTISVPEMWSYQATNTDGITTSSRCGESLFEDKAQRVCNVRQIHTPTGMIVGQWAEMGVWRSPSQVTYVSSGYDKYTNHLYPENSWYKSWSESRSEQSPWYFADGYGSTYNFAARFNDGSITVSANGIITMEPPISYTSNSGGLRCYGGTPSTGSSYTFCEDYESVFSSKVGSFYYSPAF